MKSKQKKKYSLNKKSLFLLIILVFILFLVNSTTNRLYKKNKTVFPTYTTYIDSINTKGVAIFDEEVYTAKGSGIVLFNASEGEKVPVDFEIANINLMNDTSELKDELSQINAALSYKLNEEGKSVAINDEVNVTKIQEDLKNKDLLKAISDINELDLNTQKNVSVSNLTELMSSSIEELTEEKEKLSSQIAKSNISYKADYSGVVSFKIDGLEKYYTPENLGKLTIEYLDKHYKVSDFKSETKVENKDYLFKLVNNLSYYVALKIDDFEELKDLKLGDQLNLEVDGKEDILGQVVEINKEKKKGIIVLSVNTNFDELYSSRFHNFKIVLNEMKCFEIPKSAIIKRNSMAGVYVQEIQGLVRFVPIESIKSLENSVYVSTGDKDSYITLSEKTYKTITINDSIVINPERIRESQILN
ncbi:putative membrane fusion protein [Anaerosphaera aminiphila DSM 21120]|uniref:Putative membrane fusion protein n=1 Tax=Anaerosphaera aminiphila DSM 21120 TaxID=1120995 RepID=A0A1M5NVY3_9FIRM|nr:HlyD family efflux transporter periplasmic adaptor subunit [Anaerosphaera aminiphila]SHG93339.1 putative membrane fusion protein [Anaerosphaera aminiphila DSM 21120]